MNWINNYFHLQFWCYIAEIALAVITVITCSILWLIEYIKRKK